LHTRKVQIGENHFNIFDGYERFKIVFPHVIHIKLLMRFFNVIFSVQMLEIQYEFLHLECISVFSSHVMLMTRVYHSRQDRQQFSSIWAVIRHKFFRVHHLKNSELYFLVLLYLPLEEILFLSMKTPHIWKNILIIMSRY
jgi:hypothetical protein